MDQSLLMPKFVQAILEDNAEVQEILGDDEYRIFPIQQPEELSFPFIVHTRLSVTTNYTKDLGLGFGWSNRVQFMVTCVSDDYIQAIELANACRHALEGYRWFTEDFQIEPIEFVTASEYITDDKAFVQQLTFGCTFK